MKTKTYLPDTSSVIEELITKLIKEKKIGGEIVIHKSVLAELENQANQGRPIGLMGLNEIKKLSDMAKEKKIKLRYVGERPKPEQIKLAKKGEIDAIIRDFAWKEKFVLITCDSVQNEVALASGMEVVYIPPRERYSKKIKLEKYFTPKTMSVHLKEKTIPTAKVGSPGNWELKSIKKKKTTSEELKEIGMELIEQAKMVKDAFIEQERRGSMIIQYKDYRVVITKPPLSQEWGITAVRPIKKMSLKDYELDKKLIERLDERAEGILIAGSPGMGKSTFAQALAIHYLKKNKLVRTLESPRDLDLPKEVTQYSKNHANHSEIIDILLLSRPDYTVFDEVRNPEDFRLFSELRLAGVGLVGVIHATNPIDAIQRFVGKIEMGVIPNIIDTVIFIEDGKLKKILELHYSVKVPSGMTERDLARPVIEVKDFFTKQVEYEIFVFGEEKVVMPINKKSTKNSERDIKKLFGGYRYEIKNNVLHVYVSKREKRRLIGSKGSRIRELERSIGMPIQVEEYF